MQFLSGFDGIGRYFETPAAYRAGERFEIEGADGDYQAPVGGMGRYFETPAAYRAGERFEIEGADGDYMAPVGGMSGHGGAHLGFGAHCNTGMGRYFENSFGMRNNLGPFKIEGANDVYKAPPYGGVNGLGQVDVEGPLASIKVDTHPLMWIMLGAAAGVFATLIAQGIRR